MLVARAHGLGCILYYRQTRRRCDLHDLGHFCRQTEQVYRNNSLGTRSDSRFQLLAVQVVVSGSISTNTGLALRRAMLPAVATKVNGVVTTSSPLPIPVAIRASNSASDPDAQPMAKLLPMNWATSASSFSTSGPMMKCWLSSTAVTAAKTSSLILACCALRSRKGNRVLLADARRQPANSMVDLKFSRV